MSSSLVPPDSRRLTAAELDAAIAALKPARRQHYKAKAAKEGRTLHEHLGRRLSKKIKHPAATSAPPPAVVPTSKTQVIDLTGSDDEKENRIFTATNIVSSGGGPDSEKWSARKRKVEDDDELETQRPLPAPPKSRYEAWYLQELEAQKRHPGCQPEPIKQEASFDPPPKQPRRQPCTCGAYLRNPLQSGEIACSNVALCPVAIYHKACVGLKDREPPTYWKCWQCRPASQAVAPSSTPSTSQNVPSYDAVPTTLPSVQPLHVVEPPLSREQLRVVDYIERGENVFYTGSAGTGKSTALKAFVKNLEALGKHVDIVAPSGIAALAVGGTTIFAYAGWTPDHFKEGIETLKKKGFGKGVRRRLCRTDCLVIDEISMVERDLLRRLDITMRHVRHGWKAERGEPKGKSKHVGSMPFGGVQVVVTGDFCQLPPVKPFKFCLWCGGDEMDGWSAKDTGDITCKRCKATGELGSGAGVHKDVDKWAFRGDTWEGCNFRYIELSTIHRQNEMRFIDLLQTCRLLKPLSLAQQKLLLTPKPDPEAAVKLMPTRYEVDRENKTNFDRLHGVSLPFDCLDTFVWKNKDEPDLQTKGWRKYQHRPDGPLKALNDHRFEEHVDVKLGMLVILLVNLDFDAGLVNGSQGRVVGFQKYRPEMCFVEKPNPPTSPRKAKARSYKRDSSL